MFDDGLLIPPPRRAERWYCSKCGEAGAKPEPGFLEVDARYAVGYCDCTPRRGRYPREKVQLIADFAFGRRQFAQTVEGRAMKKAYGRMRAGVRQSPEELALARRYAVRVEELTGVKHGGVD